MNLKNILKFYIQFKATLKGELSTKVTREMMKRGNEYSGFVNVRSKVRIIKVEIYNY